MAEFRRAGVADAQARATLVNSAYRGVSSRAGWTTEAHQFDGQRTDAASLTVELDLEFAVLRKAVT